MTDNKKRRIIIASFALVMVVLMCYMFLGTTYCLAEAEGVSFDKTSVNDDLKSMDLNKYIYSLDGKIEIVNFVEYCYSESSLKYDNYGLYIYIYNPKRLSISDNANANKIQMAVGYDTQGLPNNYANLPLELCGISTGDKANLIYKYKVIDEDNILLNNARVSNGSNGYRRYDIVGVQLLEKGKYNAVDYSVGGTYKFSGYAKGYSKDSANESTLKVEMQQLETIQLDVRSTNYRTASSSLGKDHQNQLDSVYFSVDNKILEQYGKLQKIKAEWYEYKTSPIVTISDKGIFDTLYGYVGKNIGEHTDSLRYSLGYDRNVISAPYTTSINYGWSYNVDCYTNIGISTMVVSSDDICKQLNYLFYTGGSSVKDYTIPIDTLKKWIYEYDKSAVKGYLPIKDGNISADLFLNTVDNGRKMGYNCVEIDASEKYDLLSYTTNHNFWDKVCDYGLLAAIFGKVPTDENVYGIEPIYAVKDSDLSYDDAGIANTLLINPSEVQDFKDYYNEAKKANKTTFLFRFAATDYFAGEVDIDDHESTNGMLIKDSAYMAQETVFLDFDIIQLTFNKDGVYHVIPVVASPIDIVGAITPPVEFEGSDWWKWVLAIILLVLLIVILFPILPYIIKAVVWVVMLPVKAVSSLMRSIGRANDKRHSRQTMKEMDKWLDDKEKQIKDDMEV